MGTRYLVVTQMITALMLYLFSCQVVQFWTWILLDSSIAYVDIATKATGVGDSTTIELTIISIAFVYITSSSRDVRCRSKVMAIRGREVFQKKLGKDL